MGYRKSSTKSVVYSNTDLPQETSQIKQVNCTPKGTRKRRTNEAQS